MPDESLLDLADYISEKLEGRVVSHEFVHEALLIHVKAEEILSVLQFMRDSRECEFTVLSDLCCVDYYARPLRFEIVYSLLSLRQNSRARVKVEVNDGQIVPSITKLYPNAAWYEREIWDMYGVLFSGNEDLRRLLTDYGFDGHPLRKDFPVTGHVQQRYDEVEKNVIYEPVRFEQDYRDFDALSPWEGASDLRGEQRKTEESCASEEA